MRRERTIILLLASGAALALSSCGPHEKPAKIYKSVAECQLDKPASECQAAFTASAAQQGQAPRFTAKAQCEAEYGSGNCETRQGSGGDSFSPMMMGFMLGSMSNNSYPVYLNHYGDMYSSRGYVGGGYRSFPSRTTVNVYNGSSARSSPAFSSGAVSASSSTSFARGGFGGSAAHFGGVSS